MLKVLERSGIQGTYIKIIKAIYSKPIANIKLNGEKLKAIPLKSGTRLSTLSPHFFPVFISLLSSFPVIISWEGNEKRGLGRDMRGSSSGVYHMNHQGTANISILSTSSIMLSKGWISVS